MNTAPAVHWIDNPYRPQECAAMPVLAEMTIQEWLDSNGGFDRLNKRPTVCVYQGRQLLRSEYKETAINEPVYFVALPQGGDGGSNPLVFIAVVVAAAFTGGAAAGLMGVTTGTGAMIGATVGMSLMSLAVGTPSMPNSSASMTGSSTYSMSAQGNQARLGDPIPVIYGKMRVFPPFAAQPYVEYDNNEQYLYQLFALTQGECQVSDIKLADTPVDNFPEVTKEIVRPGQPVTLFHTAVVTASEAGGQDMNVPVTHGPYVVNEIGTELTRIGVDVVFPSGLMGVEEDGDEYSVGVHLSVIADPIDDKGAISGNPVTIFNGSISDRTRTAVRRTLAKDVPAGRYQVTITRTTGEGGSREVMNCQLGQVRGYMADTTNYGDITLLAMRIRASASLSDQSSREVNMVVQRLLPKWSRDTGWTQPVVNNSPAWVFADILRSRYGADLADSTISLDELEYLAGIYQSRGDEFNGVFDTASNCWEALTKAAQVGRAMPVRQGNLIRMVRDQLETAHSGVFSTANISGLSIDYVMPSERTSDSVKATYWDREKGYKEQTVLCELPGETAENPEEISLFGCTSHDQAWREGMYLAASNRERRVMVSFKTGVEGYIPSYGSIVLVNHDLLGNGQMFSGYVMAAEENVLVLGNEISLPGENWYIAIRDRYGRASAPQKIEQAGVNRVRVLGDLPAIITDTYSTEPSHYMIGQGSNWSKRVKVTSVQPANDDTVKISGFIESDTVHSADSGEAPPPSPDLGLPNPAPGKVEDIRATQGGTTTQPVINLSWRQAPNSERYLIEYSKDGRQTWQPAGTGTSYVTSHSFSCDPGMVTARVAGIGALRGEWTEVQVNAGGEFDTPGQVVPVLAEPFTGNALKVKWEREAAAARYLIQVVHADRAVRQAYLDHTFTSYEYSYQDAERDTAGRVLTFRICAENGNNVSGAWGELTASNPVPAVPSNVKVTGLLNTLMIECATPADTDIRELRVYGSQTSGFEPSAANLLHTSVNALTSFNVDVSSTWYLRLAWVDNWGNTGLNFSGEFSATAEQITETEIGENAIKTPHLSANIIEGQHIKGGTFTGSEFNAAMTVIAGSGANTAGMNGAIHEGNAGLSETAFWAGAEAENVADAPTRITKTGRFIGKDVDITGRIVATSGTFAGRVVGSTIEAATFIGGTISGATGVFNGTVYADNIIGDVVSAKDIPFTRTLLQGNSWIDVASFNVRNVLNVSSTLNISGGNARIEPYELSGTGTETDVLYWRVLVNGVERLAGEALTAFSRRQRISFSPDVYVSIAIPGIGVALPSAVLNVAPLSALNVRVQMRGKTYSSEIQLTGALVAQLFKDGGAFS
ncbi:host specificity factor TipJ family phage tail protein [Endozoicomonas sp. GU-1]|uniref:host specificity factor TipJ family phage tail protein n=1 Tax=Endozoicomonas sp. GU-1 TaxID=3009078 RepID=UPI0022B499E9|nr:host specificity factor TipJ family phage tail protein [Endozoicomonas sp. GU-1]WBA79541.1 host specificity factor TipJ family phage tail protein [Endozoicomonas sp. GU-1]